MSKVSIYLNARTLEKLICSIFTFLDIFVILNFKKYYTSIIIYAE